jgi:retron-type reverse transcriptase
MIDGWRDSLDDSDSLVAVFIDLRKAFDTIDRGLLLEKLKLYGFSDRSHGLMENLLTDRKYKVKLNDVESEIKNSDIGVPEGSITGPLLFIIFINDLCYLNTESKMVLFADDTTLYHRAKNVIQQKAALIKDMMLFTT